MWDKEKEKLIEATMSQIDRQFGKGAIMCLGEDSHLDIPSIKTGDIGLDMALGVGGFPRGRIVEVYGPESSGKTTLALHVVSEAQKNGGAAAFIDAEHALDISYAKRLGVNAEELLVSQPDYGEQALEICDILVKSGGIDVIVIDSVAALVPRAEINGDMGDAHVGLQARLMSQALRKLTATIAKSNCVLIFINQLRTKIGVMFGNPETTTGGNALKFYSSIRIDIRRVSAIKQGEDVVGNRTRVKIVKNKLAPPFKVTEFDIMFGEGISKVGSLLDLASENGIVKKSGTWFSYGDERIGQGRENAKRFLKENSEMVAEIEDKVRAHFGQAPVAEQIEESAIAEKMSFTEDFHRREVEQVSIENIYNEKDQLVLDVRTPAEFAEGSIPGAVNTPLMTNEDRKIIGTIYKQIGQQEAIQKGYEVFEPKIDAFIKSISSLPEEKQIIVMCARGGMRSRAVTSLLNSRGIHASQLTGGYKSYRQFTLDHLDSVSPKSPLIILHGRTGVGKTLILQQLENHLDLEGIAQHRSSLFGAVGKHPLPQKAFEASLLEQWLSLDHTKPIFVEGESRKIGSLHIPNTLFDHMQKGIKVLVEASINTRVTRTIQDYTPESQETFDAINRAIEQLKIPLGKKAVDYLLTKMSQQDFEEVVKYLYENYYDPKYDHSLNKYDYFRIISADKIEDAVNALNEIQGELQKVGNQ